MKNKTNLKSWWRINYRWFLSLVGFIIACMLLAYGISQGSFKDMAQAYAHPSLFQKAITEANKNNEVLQTLGTLEPLDNMAILEGNTRYSNDNKAMEATVRVTGKNAKGKMDISAKKIDSEWKYEGIKIRVHETKQEIIIKK